MTGLLAAGLAVSVFAGPTLGKVQAPQAGDPGCRGNIIAFFNSNSGQKEHDSRGPGFFVKGGQNVRAALAAARSQCDA